MSLVDYSLSLATVSTVTFVLFGIPWLLLYRRSFGIPRGYLLQAVFGVYVLLTYLKPATVPLSLVPAIVLVCALLVHHRMRGGREPFHAVFREWPVWGILMFSFALFFFRWEPPGIEPTKWGALARLVYETQMIPGTEGSVSIRDLRGVSLGVPILSAYSFMGGLVPFERGVGFFGGVSLALFVFACASALGLWFSRHAALIAAVVGLILYATPQAPFVVGEAPLLAGATAGLALLELLKVTLLRRPSRAEIAIYSAAMIFAWYAHPQTATTSLILGLTLFACLAIWTHRVRESARALGVSLSALVVAAIPFFARWRFSVSPAEREAVTEWQRVLAPALFGADTGLVQGVLAQLTQVVGAWAAVVALVALAIAMIRDFRHRFHWAAWAGVAVVTGLFAGLRANGLPLSYLLIPDAIAILLTLPLLMPLGWLAERASESRSVGERRVWLGALVLASLVGGKSFTEFVGPQLFNSQLTEKDRAAMVVVESKVPWSECVDVRQGGVGLWIPVLAVRCVVPARGAGSRMVDDETGAVLDRPRWSFAGEKEKRETTAGKVIFDNGARLIYREISK